MRGDHVLGSGANLGRGLRVVERRIQRSCPLGLAPATAGCQRPKHRRQRQRGTGRVLEDFPYVLRRYAVRPADHFGARRAARHDRRLFEEVQPELLGQRLDHCRRCQVANHGFHRRRGAERCLANREHAACDMRPQTHAEALHPRVEPARLDCVFVRSAGQANLVLHILAALSAEQAYSNSRTKYLTAWHHRRGHDRRHRRQRPACLAHELADGTGAYIVRLVVGRALVGAVHDVAAGVFRADVA